jgi:hypothetical protein
MGPGTPKAEFKYTTEVLRIPNYLPSGTFEDADFNWHELESSNVEFNTFVLRKLHWQMNLHPSTAKMNTYLGANVDPPKSPHISDHELNYNCKDKLIYGDLKASSKNVKPAQSIDSEDFDTNALCNQLSCKSMYLTRPPIQALVVEWDEAHRGFHHMSSARPALRLRIS